MESYDTYEVDDLSLDLYHIICPGLQLIRSYSILIDQVRVKFFLSPTCHHKWLWPVLNCA